jgi:hypothetical protein
MATVVVALGACNSLSGTNDDVSHRQYCVKFGSIFFTPIPRTAQDFCVVYSLKVRARVCSYKCSLPTPVRPPTVAICMSTHW